MAIREVLQKYYGLDESPEQNISRWLLDTYPEKVNEKSIRELLEEERQTIKEAYLASNPLKTKNWHSRIVAVLEECLA